MTGTRRVFAVMVALAVAACGGGSGDSADATPDAVPCVVDPAGECDGDTLLRCEAGELVSEDCTATLASCADDGAGASCVDECEQAGVTEDGRCTGDGLERCTVEDGKHVVAVETCALGTTCEQPTGGAAACQADPCDAVGPSGRCLGDVLTRCDTGAPVETDCASAGEVCGYIDDGTGYGCAAPADVGAKRVHGTILYEDRPPLPSGELGSIGTMPVRGAQVVVVLDGGGGAELAAGVTADDGSYSLHYDAADGTAVHVTVAARSPLELRPISVNRTQNQVHAFGGDTFAAAADETQDLLVTDASAVSEAFNIFDQLVSVMDMIRDDLGNPTPSPLTARWSRGSNNGTYYDGQIRLLGSSSDDDGYDDTVILHEAGHYVEDTEGRSDSPGGYHDGSPTDPRLAWSEGFSTYLAMAVRGESVYMDSDASGGWGWDADPSVTEANGSGSQAQDVSEDMVCEILWDLGDGGAGDDDPLVAAGHRAALRVQVDYLASAPLRAAGVDGVDLVDFLDGWLLGEGLGACGATREIVTAARSFPYDYDGPAGTCP